jgi:hypothetical protein
MPIIGVDEDSTSITWSAQAEHGHKREQAFFVKFFA